MVVSKHGVRRYDFGHKQTGSVAVTPHQFQYMRIGDMSTIPGQQNVDSTMGANRDVVRVQKRLGGQCVDTNQFAGCSHDSIIRQQDRDTSDQGLAVSRGGRITLRDFVQNNLRNEEFVLGASFVPPTMGNLAMTFHRYITWGVAIDFGKGYAGDRQ
jgi:hypothetical protein